MPIIQDAHGWILETDHTAYAIGIASGMLVLRYWGAKLPSPDDYPPPATGEAYASFNGIGQTSQEEYPAYGGDLKYIEPCLKVSFDDGVRDVWLTYKKSILTADANALTFRLDDAHYPLRVYVTYQLHAEHDIIERYVEIQNHGDAPVVIERALSATLHLPGTDYDLWHYTGKWNDEWHLRRDHLPHGILKLDSKRGTSSHHHHPSVIVTHPNVTETAGECWFAMLETSGNWQLLAEVTDFAQTRLSMGLNDWDFAYRLEASLAFTTPSVFVGMSHAGLESASHRLHGFVRSRLPHPDYTRKVLFNSWEVTYFDVDEVNQKHYADLAASLGVELFVMDDGWFHGRNSDRVGLGDWFPDAQKFPHGLTPLIAHVNALGMDFGLWLEPEMVNADSDLYRAHPDWAIHFPTRPRTMARNQLVLNMARQDVQDYLIETISKLLRENNIAFIKWDMNRNITEAGWQTEREPKEIWVRYVEGLYRVWGTLRERFPQVIWQSCSGGGGRADLGMLKLADQVWLSDNTEPMRRLPMQNNYLYMYPPNTLEAWVTDMGDAHLPLEFRFHVSMCGNLGIGANITHWSPEERTLAAQLVAQYKEVRHIIQRGSVYHHAADVRSGNSALQFVSEDQRESVVFVFHTPAPSPLTPYGVTLRGLDEQLTYRLEQHNIKRTGAGWMMQPLRANFVDGAIFQSHLLILTAQ